MTKKSLSRAQRQMIGAYISPGFHLEADGRGKGVSVLISGVVGVRELSESEISVVTRSESFTVKGELLSVSVLESNRIRLSGILDSISFAKRKKGGRL